ncbi:hypothetical protein [Actinoallomurus acaciae]|uniref:Extracellular solute-binding protein n=1 Tax=Actinoallomurus acaciae TaxID=502577 RepID=A0ABV5YGI5_9ACTN
MGMFDRAQPDSKHYTAPGCSAHGPCQALGAMRPEARDAQLSLIIGRRQDGGLGSDPVATDIGEGLSAVLVVKAGPRRRGGAHEAVTVAHHAAAQWGADPRALWGRALANMRQDKLNIRAFDTNVGVKMHVVNGTGWPAAGQALRTEEVLGTPLPNGAIVTLPTNNSFIALPIHSRRALNMIPFMMQTSRQLMKGDPAPMSDGVFWYSHGRLESMGVTLKGDKDFSMRFSGACKQMLDSLPQG